MDPVLFFKIAGLISLAYLLGSIPWGLVLTRSFTSVDITGQGSGNIGATNVKRLAGLHWGILTLIGDVSKGFIPVYLARSLMGIDSGPDQAIVSAVALSAFLGHLYPVYLKFGKGGKGVATALGCFLAISPWACLVSIFIFIAMVYFSGRVSAGSLVASAMLPVIVLTTSHSVFFTVVALIFTVMIFWRHRENIKRLLKGTEPEI